MWINNVGKIVVYIKLWKVARLKYMNMMVSYGCSVYICIYMSADRKIVICFEMCELCR